MRCRRVRTPCAYGTWRDVVAAGEKYSADEQRSRVAGNGLTRAYVIVLKRQSLPLLATPDATQSQKEENTQQTSLETEPLGMGSGART
jgi:hypothetical protein